uniref:Major facilitator superfamily MFS_1 n=1 Tax=mine drainage metagenome TaxID=410659 RepID=E6Q637_9ZZZZ
MRTLFAQPYFTRYFVARQFSVLAYSIEAVAVGWQIYAITHAALALGFVGLLLFIPQFALAVPAGVLADRFDRRKIVFLCSFGEALGVAFFAYLAWQHSHALWAYGAALLVSGIARATSAPAERALLVGIVDESAFQRASAFTNSIGQMLAILGPAAAGALIALSTPFAFAVAAFAYLASTLAYASLRVRSQRHLDPGELDPIGGIRYLREQPEVLGAISLDLFAVLFGGATALLPIFATTILHVGPLGFGLMRAAPGLGAALVAWYLSRRPLERGAGRALYFCVAAFGIATIVFGLSKNLALSLVALLAIGGFDMVSVVIRMTLVQLRTPDRLRGRVSAIENIFIGASNELGAFESGVTAAWLGAEASVAIGGLATLAIIIAWGFAFPQLRRMDRLEAPR